MKTALLIMVTFISSLALAGGSGGGGVLRATISSADIKVGDTVTVTDVIHYIGKKNGLVQFAHGQLVDDEYQVQNLEMSLTELSENPVMIPALQMSEMMNDWVGIKQAK